MKIDPADLTEIFKQMLADQYAAEKKSAKLVAAMAKKVTTAELRSAVSAEATDVESHISRLSRALSAVKQKPTSQLAAIDEEILKLLKAAGAKGATIKKDVQLLHLFKLLFNSKVARYESLYRMATALDFPEHALLLEQCSKDNQNTFAYLNQVEQNVIYAGT